MLIRFFSPDHSLPSDRAPEAKAAASVRAVIASEADVHLFGLVASSRRDWFGWLRKAGW